jgi:hypothetical protein
MKQRRPTKFSETFPHNIRGSAAEVPGPRRLIVPEPHFSDKYAQSPEEK